MLARFHHIVHCLCSQTVAGIAPSETRGKNWIQRQFRGETKPSKHRFKPSSRSDVPLASETKRSCKSLRVNAVVFFPHGTAYGNRFLVLF